MKNLMILATLGTMAGALALAGCGTDVGNNAAAPANSAEMAGMGTMSAPTTTTIAKGTHLKTADYDIYIGDAALTADVKPVVTFPVFIKDIKKAAGMSCLLKDKAGAFLGSSVGPINKYSSGVISFVINDKNLTNATLECEVNFDFKPPALPANAAPKIAS